MKPKTAVIIQARMGSTRLPGKAMLPLNGKPALQRLIERVQRAEGVDQIIVATPGLMPNAPIWDLCWDLRDNMQIEILPFAFAGSEEDVLARVLDAAHLHHVDIIVDITGDCPLVDHRHITQLVKMVKDSFKFWKRNVDYASNIYPRSWPDGADCQVYRTRALERVRKQFNPPHHVGWNIMQYPDTFKIAKGLKAPPWLHWPKLRVTLDERADYVVLDKIFKHFRDKDFSMEEVIMLMRRKVEWQMINKKVRTKTPQEG